ncbi:hypothetical protein BDZ89DRAFT_1141425 [Hymenopellis radicata]|nr:hypothetical protein BDZ89DRAFT_1141425 [Hymenopellis radicata]
MQPELQLDNVSTADGPDIKMLRGLSLTDDPGLRWPHQVRFEEIKRRLGERKALVLFSKLKAMDKADKGWRAKAICTKCRDPQFKPNFTFVCPCRLVLMDVVVSRIVLFAPKSIKWEAFRWFT